MIPGTSPLWQYLSPEQQSLARDGELLVEDRQLHPNEKLSDYSYLVFPFAKLYEGFLKRLFRDLGIISDREYSSDHFRLGKALSPNLVRRLGEHSAWGKIRDRFGTELANELWAAWKEGRNLVFHYFPHNYRALTLEEAKSLIALLVKTMTSSVSVTGVKAGKHT